VIPAKAERGALPPVPKQPLPERCQRGSVQSCGAAVTRWAWFPDYSSVTVRRGDLVDLGVDGWWAGLCDRHAAEIPDARLEPRGRCSEPDCPEHGDHEALYAEPESSTADVSPTPPMPLRRSAISPADGLTVRGTVYFRPVDSIQSWRELGRGEVIVVPDPEPDVAGLESVVRDADGWCTCAGHQETKRQWMAGEITIPGREPYRG